MSISHLSSTHLSVAANSKRNDQQRTPLQFSLGEFVSLKVTKRLDERHYLVSLANSQHVVESSVKLEVGSQVRAAVVSVVDKLELKYVSSEVLETRSADPQEIEVADELSMLEQRYAVALDARERHAIRQELQAVAEPMLLIQSGMFLNKLTLEVESAALKALYASQVWPSSEESPKEPQQVDSLTELAKAMGDSLDPASMQLQADTTSGASDSSLFGEGGGSKDQRQLAKQILNQQNDGSVDYRYGVLPVLIGDELVELDLAYFRERREMNSGEGTRRLVMTFSTPRLGRVEIAAQALGERLSVAIKTDIPRANEALAARVDEAKELAARFGWQVEAVKYELQADAPRAARHIIEHVVNANTLSRLA